MGIPGDDTKDIKQKLDKQPGEGLRSLKTSGVFRAVNFELYTRPVSKY